MAALDPDSAQELIEALGAEPALLVAREPSAHMAIVAAAERPELVRGLILIDASPGDHWDEWATLERPVLVVRDPSGSLSIRDAVRMVNRQPRAKLVEVGRPDQLGPAAQAWLRSLVD